MLLLKRLLKKPATQKITAHLRYMDVERLLYFKRIFDQVKPLEGDLVECGVAKGRSLSMLAMLAIDEGKQRNIWAFDSFEGLPEGSQNDHSVRNPQAGQMSYSPYQVKEYLDAAGVDPFYFRAHITLIKGYFENTLKLYRGKPIVLLNLDVDLHDSYLTCLEELYPKVSPGGAILFDEYFGTWEYLHYPGAKQAIDQFLEKNHLSIQRDETCGKYYAVKK